MNSETFCLQCNAPISPNRKYCSDLCKERYRYAHTIKKKKCIVCKKEFEGSIGTKCCSEKCKLKAQKKYKKICPVCGTKFKARGNGIYCSDVCYRTANSTTKGLIIATCDVCHNKFQTLKSNPEATCSDKCSSRLFSTYISNINREIFGTTNKAHIQQYISERRVPSWEEKQRKILR